MPRFDRTKTFFEVDTQLQVSTSLDLRSGAGEVLQHFPVPLFPICTYLDPQDIRFRSFQAFFRSLKVFLSNLGLPLRVGPLPAMVLRTPSALQDS